MKTGTFLNKILSFPRFVFVLIFVGLTAFNPQGLFASEKEITFAALGDCVISRKISVQNDPGFLKLVELLRRADCTYGNCETTFYNPGGGFPAWKNYFSPNHFCPPWGADQFKWLGIDLVSLANDHIMDFAYNGLYSTMENLQQAGIGYAGAGKDLDHAASPGYVETAAGVVSLVSCSSSVFEINSRASVVHPYMKGRPGLNAIGVDFSIRVTEALFARLNDLKQDVLAAAGIPVEKTGVEDIETVDYGPELRFSKGDETGIVLIPKEKDLDRVYAAIKIAKNNSRIVIATIHEHRGTDKNRRPTKFQEDFARKCIEAGADMFIGTGPHVLWGLEIYKGKPIFHSLGNFLFHEIKLISPEAYREANLPAYSPDPMLYAGKFDKFLKSEKIWQSIIPIITFNSENNLKKIELYPITLEKNVPLHRRGTPCLAAGKEAAAIMEEFKKLSIPYHTTIVFRDGVGRVVL
ncbi:MAG: CapA family protein [Candidatus Aminicenantes bacterium]|nr:MAG: CapA family protein [Candidatus Aminicenantes bacterium]